MARLKPAPGHVPPAPRGQSPGMAPAGSGWGWEGAGPPESPVVGGAEPQGRWHWLWHSHGGLGA